MTREQIEQAIKCCNPYDEDCGSCPFNAFPMGRCFEVLAKTAFNLLLEDRERLEKQVKGYQDKIEQGTLIELTCKVGDTVYAIVRKGDISSGKYIVKPFIEKGKVRDIMVGSCGFNIYAYFENIGYLGFHEESEVFLTREEAEKKLKELQE